MADLVANRLSELHGRVCKDFPISSIRHACVTMGTMEALPAEFNWPMVPVPGGWHIGLDEHRWNQIIGADAKKKKGRMVYWRHFLRIGGRLWEGVYLVDWKAPKNLPSEEFNSWLACVKDNSRRSMESFDVLAEEAFDSIDLDEHVEPLDPLRDRTVDPRDDRKSDRWIEFMYSILAPTVEEHGWCEVMRLPGTLLPATARAIERIQPNIRVTVRRVYRNEARDRWLYDQRMAGLDLKTIRIQLAERAPDLDWDLITSEPGILLAIDRFAVQLVHLFRALRSNKRLVLSLVKSD